MFDLLLFMAIYFVGFSFGWMLGYQACQRLARQTRGGA